MSKKLTQEEVIKQFKEVHGDKYDYSKVKYVNTKTKVEIICDVHGSFYQTPETHKCGGMCGYCAGQKTHINDSIGMKRSDLIKYFVNKDDAFKYSLHSNKRIKLKCPNCEFKKSMTLNDFEKYGFYCNECNSFEKKYPKLMKYLVDKEDGKLPKNSGKKVKVKCPDCKFEKDMTIDKLSYRGFSCSICSDGISIPEKFIGNVLLNLKINFKTQYAPKWSENKRYDFYIDDIKAIIETHGGQHYVQSNRGRSLQEEQENDKIKKDLASRNGIKKYIRIDCRESNFKWLKKNCVEELSSYFNLSNVDWCEIWDKCQNSLMKKICEVWNNKKESDTVATISNNLKLSIGTVSKYLKRGTLLKWCNYNSKKESQKGNRKGGISRGIETHQYTIECDFIRKYTSLSEAERQTKIKRSDIGDCCHGKRKTAGGYI